MVKRWSGRQWMKEALALARKAEAMGEVPVGALIVHNGHIIAQAHNRTRIDNDPSAHAEILALRQAALRIGNWRLHNCEMWVTLEPCAMCAGAIAHAQLPRLYYGAHDAKGGAIEHGARLFSLPQTHHKPEIYSGFSHKESAILLQKFFQKRRS